MDRVMRLVKFLGLAVALAACLLVATPEAQPPTLMYGVFNGSPKALAVDTDGNLNISASISGADGAIQDGASAAIEATVFDLTASNALATQIVDANGDAITSFGGGTQYTEAATDASITGTAMLMEGAADALVPVQGTVADGLLVNLGGNNDVTVTGTVTANLGATDNAVLDDIADGIAVTNAGTFAVQSVEGAGALLTAAQLIDNLVQAEDAVAGSAFAGVGMLAVRQDSHVNLAADGDFIPFTVDADGGLRVSIVAGAGSGGTALADDADFTAGTTSVTPAGGLYQSTVTACTDGDLCGVGITAQRTVKVTLFSAAGAELTPSADMTVGTAFGTTGPGNLLRYQDFDGSAIGTATNVDTEGEAVPPAGSIKGVQYVMLTSEDAALQYFTSTTPGVVSPASSATGGATIFRSIDLDESEEEIKATAGTLYSMWVTNTATATRFIKCYNATAANVTVGTTTPVITVGIPGNATDDIAGHLGAGAAGAAFDTAITCAATTAVADNDTGAPGANEVIVNAFYK